MVITCVVVVHEVGVCGQGAVVMLVTVTVPMTQYDVNVVHDCGGSPAVVVGV